MFYIKVPHNSRVEFFFCRASPPPLPPSRIAGFRANLDLHNIRALGLDLVQRLGGGGEGFRFVGLRFGDSGSLRAPIDLYVAGPRSLRFRTSKPREDSKPEPTSETLSVSNLQDLATIRNRKPHNAQILNPLPHKPLHPYTLIPSPPSPPADGAEPRRASSPAAVAGPRHCPPEAMEVPDVEEARPAGSVRSYSSLGSRS